MHKYAHKTSRTAYPPPEDDKLCILCVCAVICMLVQTVPPRIAGLADTLLSVAWCVYKLERRFACAALKGNAPTLPPCSCKSSCCGKEL